MKSPPAATDDCDDIFGPPRTYPVGYSPPKTRPSMISAKYRQKEERRKVLKISLNKLKKIEDPESSLCRSVLINNTMRRLQQEAREDKASKQQPKGDKQRRHDFHAEEEEEFVAVESDFDARLAQEIVSAKNMEVFGGLDDTLTLDANFSSKRRGAFDEVEDCDVQDVLKQFYMPPTPRMLTCIDEDEEPTPKRPKIDEHGEKGEYGVSAFINNNIPSDANSSFSCGHASMFNELQNNVYHNLIASLET